MRTNPAPPVHRDPPEAVCAQEQSKPTLSVVIPVYQEEETVAACISGVARLLQAEGLSFEIIAVDDGSQDRSFEVLRHLQTEVPQLRVAQHVYNRGNGASLRTGIRVARAEIVVTMDADGQHDAAEILKVLAHIPPYDMVIGYRTGEYQGAWYRNAANRFYNAFASWLARFEIKDLTSGFRAMRRTAVTHFLPLFPAGFSAPSTMTLSFLKAGYNVKYVPIQVQPRRGGKSKVNLWRDGSRFVIVILRIILLYDPLRIFLPIAAAAGVLGTLAWILGMANAGRLVVPNATLFLYVFALLDVLLGLLSSQLASTRVHYFGDETVVEYDSADPSLTDR